MRIVVTGGGTGGHVYPALEVAKLAAVEGHDVRYFGSFRGIEQGACRAAGIDFTGFEVAPMPRLFSPTGLRAAIGVLKSASMVRSLFSKQRPDVVFATGGYAAGPVLAALRGTDIPLVLHEQNTIPGRTIRTFARIAKKVCIVFEESSRFFGPKAVVTGMPVRKELVEAAERQVSSGSEVSTLVYGGSQGSAALNEAAITVAAREGKDKSWLLITGPSHFERITKAMDRSVAPERLVIKAFLSASEISEAYASTSIAIVRSGCGTISELALFGIPAVFVPYPFAFAEHQLHNARAIEAIGGGSVLEQSKLSPQTLETHWSAWLDADKRAEASKRLRRWSKPNATRDTFEVVKGVLDAASV
jgi:UDP-N-acetylglucosamine--N-acetylmuramyl-(pentapeptide) pyrophosphoryl-undecaprenol N-acetylglucosamine transferase